MLRILRRFCSKQIKRKTEMINDDIIFEAPADQLMDKPKGIDMPGNKERQFTNLSELQQEIIDKKSFDLLDERIEPKTASISDRHLGDDVVQIDLGRLGVMSQNEVLLENVDPKKIPQDMDILFKAKKRMYLVGKLMDERGEADKSNMNVSDATFQEHSIEEYRQRYLGFRLQKLQFDKSEFFRNLILFLPLYFLLAPFLQSLAEYRSVKKSIDQIQEVEAKSLKQLTKPYLSRTLLDNHIFH